ISSALLEVFDGLDLPNTKIVGLQNLLSEKEMTEKISEALGL
ncbi:MAG: PTS ascorbate transporter subunit IIB, partial [Streptococcus sp.]|nr:PTS ascorbate transporter subunit IIB [Streptococcus sp.]